MRSSRFPSFAASAILHLAVFLVAFITWPMWNKKIEMSEAVPITIVASAPQADVRPAQKADAVQAAAAPEPEPTPQPASPAPEPAPEPTPAPPPPAPAPRPVPKPRPKPPTPAPKPQPIAKPQPIPRPLPKPTPAPPPPPKAKPQDLNLDQLAAAPKTKSSRASAQSSSLDLTALAASPKGAKSNAPRGPARAETDFLARLAVGKATALSGDAMSALQSKLNRLWNPNCEVEGGGGVQVRVEMKLSPTGYLIGSPSVLSEAGSGIGQDIIAASAQRASSAVKQGEPYTEIPRDGPHDIILKFNAKQACSR